MTPKNWRTLATAGLLLGAIFLGGCTAGIKERGAIISDKGLEDAAWYICAVSPVGAVKRKFGRTAEEAETYRAFCHGSGTATANPIAPVEPE